MQQHALSQKGQCRNLTLTNFEKILKDIGFKKILSPTSADQRIYVQAISHTRVGPYEEEQTYATSLVVILDIDRGLPSSFTIFYEPEDAKLAALRLITLSV